MGYRTRVTGELRIEPPVSYSDLKGNKWFYQDEDPAYYMLRINTIEERVDAPDGFTVKITGVSVSYGDEGESFKAYSMDSHIQELHDSLPNGTTLTGYLECTGEDGRQSRICVRDGKVEVVVPKTVWPEWM